MAKRLGRTIISRTTADYYAFEARLIGADRATLSGDCERPVVIATTGLKSKELGFLAALRKDGLEHIKGHGFVREELPGWFVNQQPKMNMEERVQHVDIEVRCRKCKACRTARAHHWRMRAEQEIAMADRTWFGTLTLAPEKLFALESEAALLARRGEVHWNSLSEPERFQRTSREITKHLQLYMKRLRKRADGLRYMLVFEPHKSGAPHMHMLLHETSKPIRHAALQSCWDLGFSKFNLVDDESPRRAAYYVAKYLSKAMSHRVLSSQHYGTER